MDTTEQLIKRGFAVAPAVTGYTLPQVLRRFQAAHLSRKGMPLAVDGEYGPETDDALYNVYPLPLATFEDRVLAVARAMVGMSEVPPGSNKGPQIDLILKSVGLSPGYAWCAAFTHWVCGVASYQLGVKNPHPKNAGVLNLWDLAGYPHSELTRITAKQALANPALIKPGMLFILKLGPTAGHTGLVESVENRHLTTLEGNSNVAGSREGTAVLRQTRRHLDDASLVGFICLGSPKKVE